MSMAVLPAKCMMARVWDPKQSGLGQRVTFSPSGRTSGVSHTGQILGIWKGLGVRRALFDDDLHHFRDDIAGPLDQDRIPHPHVLAGHFVFIVQGGPADRDPAHLHRLHHRHGGDRAGAARR